MPLREKDRKRRRSQRRTRKLRKLRRLKMKLAGTKDLDKKRELIEKIRQLEPMFGRKFIES
jgi:hypothetical protein